MAPSDENRLNHLQERIDAMKAARAPAPSKTEDHHTMAQVAWRMVIELVAGIAIGFGIGYGLDAWLGTMPIFLILFIGLGLAAGIRTMMRTAQEVQDKNAARAAEDERG